MTTTGGSNAKVYTADATDSLVHDKVETGIRSELNYYYKKSDVDANYYTKSDVDTKLEALTTTGEVATNKDNITKLDGKTAGLSADGKSLSGMTTVSGTNVEAGALTVTGEIKNGAGVTTTLAAINDSMNKTTANEIAIGELQRKTQKIDYDAANDTTSVNGMKVGQRVDMGGKDLTRVGAINGTKIGTKVDGTYIHQDSSIWGNMKNVDTQVKTNADAIRDNTTAITKLDTKVGEIDDRTGGIARNAEKTQTTIEGSVKVDNKGNVKDVKDLSAETITTKGDAVIGGKLGVTGETTLSGELKAEKDATFEKNVTVEKDLTVDGKLNVGEIYLENNKLDAATGEKHDSATAITADGISNLAKVTEHGNTTESQFTHNKKGTINYAKVENSTGDWKVSTSKVTADGVSNKMTDSAGNTHTYSQTATESKEQLVNGDKSNFEKKTAEGNTISIKDKDADGNLKSLTNKQTVDDEAGIRAFDDYVRYFNDYGLPTIYDFVSRFRSGEMPIGISAYSTYNTLMVSAPEIRGLWDFTLIPGTEYTNPDGTTYIDRSDFITGSATMMIATEDESLKQKSWEFMKWWAKPDTQVRFGREIEALLGSSARYATANKDAFEQLSWSSDDIKVLSEQWDQTVGIREVPGGYYTGRHITNAIRKVINDKDDTRETIIDYSIKINEEIEKKRNEFGLPME